MKSTVLAIILSLPTFSFAAPVDAGARIGAENIVIPPAALGVYTADASASTDLVTRHAGLAIDAAADTTTVGTDFGLGVIPAHANDRRHLQAIESVLAPIEDQVRVLVTKLSSETITIDEAITIIPELTALLIELQAHCLSLAGLDVEVKDIAIHIKGLIEIILRALDCVTEVLATKIDLIEFLIVDVGVAIQGVLDVAVGVCKGLDVQLAAVLKPLIDICIKIGIHIEVGALVV